MVRAFQTLGEKVQIVVIATKRLEGLDGREHVVTIDPGASVPFAHKPELMIERKPARVLRMPAINAINESSHAPFRGAQQGDCAISLDIDPGHLFALAQVADRFGPRLGRDPERDTAACPATIQPEYEARLFRSTAVHEGVDTQRAVQADQPSRHALDEIEARAPHQRAVTENPKVARRMIKCRFHDGPAHNKAPTQLQGIAR
jgi:hypothetical protein